MALNVNTEVWGEPADWVSQSGQSTYLKYPWSRSTWTNMVARNHMPVNTDIDTSIAPWRISKKSSLINIKGLYWWNNYRSSGIAGNRGKMFLAKKDIIEIKNTPFILSMWASNTYTRLLSKYWAYNINGETKSNSYIGNRYPIANFKYDEIKILPVYWVTDKDPESTVSINLGQLTQNSGMPTMSDFTTYPWCVGIGFRILVNYNGTYTEYPLTLDLPFDYLGDDQITNYFAGSHGMGLLTTPYMINKSGTHYNNWFTGQIISISSDSSSNSYGQTDTESNFFRINTPSSSSTLGAVNCATNPEGFTIRELTDNNTSGILFSGNMYWHIQTESDLEELHNIIKQELAYIGLPFVLDSQYLSSNFDSENVYLPVFDGVDGEWVTTGEYKNGTESQSLMNASWQWVYDIELPTPPNLWILPQRPLIHVYGEKTTNFNTNGYAIIEPISCEVYHEENGEYSAQFETYCDEYGKFTYLHKQAQVKIPIRYHGEVSWQIFRVMNTHRIMNADGTYRIRALAYHKFYDNNNFLIKSAHPTGMSGITALPYICTHSLYNSQIYPFEASSDITAGKTAYYDNMSITNALLGADQCFVNRWGGKLYRDNLHFSINDEMEYNKSAGVISYAYNLTDIDFEEDDTELITDLIAEDNFGNSYHIGVPDSELRVPNRIYAYRSFYYDEEDVQAFHADAAAYLDEYKQSVVNITVNFLNLSELDKYKEFQQLDAYEVGDRVIIYHKDLDIYYSHLEIISKRYDVVKRQTVEIQIGDFKNAITQRAYMSDTISDGQTAQDKMNAQLFAQDTKIMSVSISGMETFDIFSLEKRTINELEGR